MISTNQEFGARIREIRERAGLSQVELASRLDVSQSSLSRLEDGSRTITARQLVAIGDQLGISVSQLVAIGDPEEGALLRAGEADNATVADSLRVFGECIDQFRGVQALAG